MSSQEPAPDVLYHYTKLQGLMGIVKDQSLRATDIRYLNDTSEFTYAVDIAKRYLTKMSKEGKLPQHFAEQVTPFLKRSEDFSEDFHVFVFCLSAERDLLSQWRAYGHGSEGLCIGFRAQDLRNAAAQQSFALERCIYDVNKQNALVASTIDSGYAALLNEADIFHMPHARLIPPYTYQRGDDPSPGVIVRSYAMLCAQSVLRAAPTIKHPSFKAEEEWRLVWPGVWPGSFREQVVKHRPSGTILIPYCEFKLSAAGNDLGISEVIAGPTSVEIAIDSLKGFLKAEKLTGCKVEKSEIPYREL